MTLSDSLRFNQPTRALLNEREIIIIIIDVILKSDPIVVELLFTMLLTIPWSIFMSVHLSFLFHFTHFFLNSSMYSIHRRDENPYLSTFLGEVIGLSVLWLFWIVGAAIASVSLASSSKSNYSLVTYIHN